VEVEVQEKQVEVNGGTNTTFVRCAEKVKVTKNRQKKSDNMNWCWTNGL
jgi:hypothetical protein